MIDLALHSGNMTSKAIEDMESMMKEGCTSFKAFTCRPYGMDSQSILAFMKKIKDLGAVAMFHCEDQDALDAVSSIRMTKPMDFPRTRPREAEIKAMASILAMAEKTLAEVHIVHVSTAEGAELIREYKTTGLNNVTAEVCLHHLVFCENDMIEHGAALKINPPLRTKGDNEALWKALADGTLDFAATDHFFVPLHEKNVPIDKAPAGIPGMSALAVMIFSQGVTKGRLTLQRYQEIMAENQAKRFSLFPRKGALTAGSDADIVLLERTGPAKFDPPRGWSPYMNLPVSCRIKYVISAGKMLFQNGQICNEKARGKYLLR